MTDDSARETFLSTEDTALIERARQRFLDSCSARGEMSEAVSDGMSLVGIVKRLTDLLERKQMVVDPTAPLLLAEEESVELDDVRARHKHCVLRTAHRDRDTLLIIVDRLTERFLTLHDVYATHCSELDVRKEEIVALENAMRIVQSERDEAVAEVQEDVGVMRCLRRHRDKAEGEVERLTAELTRMEGEYRALGDQQYAAASFAEELQTVLNSKVE